MTDDLLTFMRAQLDEDERVARAALRADGGERGEWERGDRSPTGGTDVWDLNSRSDRPDRGFYRLAGGLDPEVVDHIARHDPARVLAEVEAKRRILDLHAGDHYCPMPGLAGVHGQFWMAKDGGCSTLRLLALPRADRAGYRDEWRP